MCSPLRNLAFLELGYIFVCSYSVCAMYYPNQTARKSWKSDHRNKSYGLALMLSSCWKLKRSWCCRWCFDIQVSAAWIKTLLYQLLQVLWWYLWDGFLLKVRQSFGKGQGMGSSRKLLFEMIQFQTEAVVERLTICWKMQSGCTY